MEYRRHILPSSLEHHNFAPEEANIRLRRPLSSSAGNAQLSTLAPPSYHGDKGQRPRFIDERNLHSAMTLPSQSSRESVGYTLQQRKQHFRSQREQKHSKQTRNPIVDSAQYQAYRERATREGNPDDQKWPDILEDAFLDALLVMPIMGRRKFSYRGKPHGRNELIAEYLWIYYLQSLNPGEIPDQTMRRGRKQVSSHIQVIKGFLKTHPYIDKIFPKSSKPENGFQDDSFKNNPCLRAISEGRLPSRRYSRFNNQPRQIEVTRPPPPRTVRVGPMRPCTFWLLITPHSFPEEQSASSELDDLYRANMVAHRFSNLTAEAPRGSLDTVSDWQHRFPNVEHLRFMGELNCDIIHMDVALEVMMEYPGKGAELCCRTEVTMPGRVPTGSEWILRTTFTKPFELCRNGVQDPISEESQMVQMAGNEAETRFKVPFPANSWAVAITRLIDIQKQRFNQDTGNPRSMNNSPVKSARKCIEEMSMYQEILCSTVSSTGQRNPLIRKAIILWTFRENHAGEPNHTTWRYIDAFPSRRAIMSPSPSACHQVSSAMYENFNSFVDPPMHHPTMLNNSYPQGLATPPLTAGIHSPYDSQAYTYNPNLSYDLPADNLSFMSSKTADSESTLVDDNPSVQMDQYLSGNLHLNDYESTTSWHLPVTSETFDADPAWPSYAPHHNNNSQVWDHPTPVLPSTSLVDLAKPQMHQWHDHPPHPLSHHQKQNGAWLENSTVTTPEGQREGSYIEQHQQHHSSAPWMESSHGAGNSTKNNSIDVTDSSVVCSLMDLASQQSKWGGGENDNAFGFVRGG